MSLSAFVASLVIMLVGLAGTILPVLPGIVIIYFGYFLYGVLTSWRVYGAGTMVLWGAVTAATLVLDLVAPMLGARRFRSSILGMWGSLAGTLIGLILFGLPGLVAGTFVGAVVGELMARRSTLEALKCGKAALIGLLAGSLLKVVVGLIMVGAFVWRVAMH